MKDLTKIYIDLSKCTEEQRKHIISLLPAQTESAQYVVAGPFKNLHLKDERWVTDTTTDDKTELSYTEFIKLFESGEGETQVEHTCKYCGCLTTQPDSECYAAPKNQVETLYRKVAVSEQNPTKSGEYFTNEGTLFYASTYNGFEHNTDPHRVYPDWWLEEIPNPNAKLIADKSELLEALEKTNNAIRKCDWTENEGSPHLIPIYEHNHSLIQKHKQCGTA